MDHHHVASPDAHVLPNGDIILYFHSGNYDHKCQYTFAAVSSDGLNFKTNMRPLGSFYFRAFIMDNTLYSISKSYDRDAEMERDAVFSRKEHKIESYAKLNLYPMDGSKERSVTFEVDQPFIPLVYFLPNARHTAVKVINNNHILLFYTLIGEAPEQLYCANIYIKKTNYNEMESFDRINVLNDVTAAELYLSDSQSNRVSLNLNLPFFHQAIAPATHIAFRNDNISASLLKLINAGVHLKILSHQRIAYPEEDYEGISQVLSSSHIGQSYKPENALRDPAYFFDTETNKSFLLYSYGGEMGIALAEIEGMHL
jgi:hypothetical protein